MNQHVSLWQQTVDIPSRPPLQGNLETEAVVIGAGLAGVLIADALTRRGIRTVTLEAKQIGSGQTKNTTAKITSQHGLIYTKLLKQLGAEGTRQYAQANEQAIAAYAEMIAERGIDCDFEETSAYLYSTTDAESLRAEAEAAASVGIRAHFTTDTELPFPVAGAVRFDGQASFHPLKFLRAVSEKVEIYEHTPVLSVEDGLLQTEHGRVRAKYVIFASHFPFINVPGWYFMRMHQERSYVLALSGCAPMKGLYYGVDADGLSFRPAGNLLLLGGAGHRTGENKAGGRYAELLSRAHSLYPDAQVTAQWSAQDCMPLDHVPYIGPYAASAPQWYVATGFAKWGMTTSMVAARLISSLIAGETPEWAEVFSPARFHPGAALPNLMNEAGHAVHGLTRGAFSIPDTVLAELPCGHGGLVEVGGVKVGVYKEENGRCHMVDPRCPHLGCELTWNPDEKTWDCPCHGSRFRYDGMLLDNPAQTDLDTPAP